MINEQLTLGQLIDELKKCVDPEDPDKGVCFDFSYFRPSGDVFSYRGYYDQFCIGYEDAGNLTLISLINILQKSVDQNFHGYKGGEFRMHKDVPVWVDRHNYASGTAIVGVYDAGWTVYIKTEKVLD